MSLHHAPWSGLDAKYGFLWKRDRRENAFFQDLRLASKSGDQYDINPFCHTDKKSKKMSKKGSIKFKFLALVTHFLRFLSSSHFGLYHRCYCVPSICISLLIVCKRAISLYNESNLPSTKIGRIWLKRNYIRWDISLAKHAFLWILGIMSEWIWFLLI